MGQQPSDTCAARRSDLVAVGGGRRWPTLGICGLLLLAIALVFCQTVGFEFVNWDDNDGIFENPRITGGLKLAAVTGMFTQRHIESWCPLTSVSHLLTWCAFGGWAGGHHLANVALHAASTLLLFLLLRRMTAAVWPSALVAGLFAVHPLHVESVAWVTERKDALERLVLHAALGAYVGYVSARGESRRGRRGGEACAEREVSSAAAGTSFVSAVCWYLVMLIFFALGLLAKPMVITLPFVLLLLDYWPLGRLTTAREERGRERQGGRRGSQPASPPLPHLSLQYSWLGGRTLVLCEKLPLFILVGFSCWMTIRGQGGAMEAKCR